MFEIYFINAVIDAPFFEETNIFPERFLDLCKGKEKTKKYNFQGQSARSMRWFDLDHEWLEENLVHVNRISKKTLYQTNIKG